MTLNISVPTTMQELRPIITVVGVGGAGGNAVNNMISANLEGVDFLVANTDGQALAASLASRKIQLGRQQTEGLGAGSAPEIGRIAAQESLDEIMAELTDSHMVFITAGMGGGTGTGAAPVIAKAARERGILTVGVVTKPFDFEGPVRMRQANSGIEELQAYVDTLIIIPNQNLFRLANERTTLADAFAMADDVLHKGVSGVTDLMIKPGNINLDFADIRAVMSEMGKAMMGTGEASGENRAANAAEAAINNPLLDETTMQGAQAVLINITGGPDMTLFEVDEAANHIRREVDAEATIIFGSAIDDRMEGIMRVSVVATGMEGEAMSQRPPLNNHVNSRVMKPMTQPSVHAETAPEASVASFESAPAADLETPSFITPELGSADDQLTMMADDHIDVAASETDDLDVVMVDDNQQDLVALVDEARAEMERDQLARDNMFTSEMSPELEADLHAEMQAEIADQRPEMQAEAPVVDASGADASGADTSEDHDITMDDASEDEPFTLRDITDIPEDAPAEDSKKPVSLIGHLTGMFGGKKATAEVAKTEPELDQRPSLNAEDSVSVMGMPQVEPHVEAQPEAKLDQPEQVEASKPQAEEKPAEQVSGLAALKPTPQPKLDIDDPHADVDLDIPAFLRRQAN